MLLLGLTMSNWGSWTNSPPSFLQRCSVCRARHSVQQKAPQEQQPLVAVQPAHRRALPPPQRGRGARPPGQPGRPGEAPPPGMTSAKTTTQDPPASIQIRWPRPAAATTRIRRYGAVILLPCSAACVAPEGVIGAAVRVTGPGWCIGPGSPAAQSKSASGTG